MENLIAKSVDEYVSKVINLSNNNKEYLDLRKSIFLDALKTPLFNQKNFSNNFFHALEEIIN